MNKTIYSVTFNSEDLNPKIKDQLVNGVFGTNNLNIPITDHDVASGRLSSKVTLNLITNQLDLEILQNNSGVYLKTFLNLGFNITAEIIYDYPDKVSHINFKIQGVGFSPTGFSRNGRYYPESLWNKVLGVSMSCGDNKKDNGYIEEDNNYIKEWDLKL